MADSLEILNPDIILNVGGGEVKVREFSFRQSLELGPSLAPLLAGIDSEIGEGDSLSGLIDQLYAYPAELMHMLRLSTSQDQEWIDSLSAEDGDKLVLTFWSVNAGFFMRRLVMRRQIAKQQRAVKDEQAKNKEPLLSQ